MGNLHVEGGLLLHAPVCHHLLSVKRCEQLVHQDGEVGSLLLHGGDDLLRMRRWLGWNHYARSMKIEHVHDFGRSQLSEIAPDAVDATDLAKRIMGGTARIFVSREIFLAHRYQL